MIVVLWAPNCRTQILSVAIIVSTNASNHQRAPHRSLVQRYSFEIVLFVEGKHLNSVQPKFA